MYIIPFLNKKMHAYGCELNILQSPLKNWMPQNFKITNFGHQNSRFWLKPCHWLSISEGKQNYTNDIGMNITPGYTRTPKMGQI